MTDQPDRYETLTARVNALTGLLTELSPVTDAADYHAIFRQAVKTEAKTIGAIDELIRERITP